MAIISYASELKIATSWDNTAGYSLITDVTDGDSIPFLLPLPYVGRSRGILKPRLSRRVDYIAEDTALWTFPFMSIKQLDTLFTTYYNANDSKVTVRTITSAGGFADYNAYISIRVELQGMAGDGRLGIGTVSAGNYTANWLADVVVGFAIDGTAS